MSKDICITRILFLRGPNIWTYRPVLEAWVDIGELEDCPSNTLPGFNQRLSVWLPTLAEHRCSYGEPGGFVRRLEEGTWPAHILEHVTLELQNLAGMPGGFGKARETPVRGLYKVAVRCWHEDITGFALHAARDLLMAAIEDRAFDVAAVVARLRDMADKLLLGPSTACIVDAATAKDRLIPAIRLSGGNLVQLGYGVRQRRIWTAETDRTGAIAEGISRDKALAKTLLSACGVPVPEGCAADSPEAAWAAAQDIGLPVVVKPSDANHGRGVSMDLSTREDVEAAWRVARAEGSGVLVERFVRGHEHRLLVVGGKVVAAARGELTTITGDGRSTVAQLIDSQLNSDPRRGKAEAFPLETIVLEREPVIHLELERQGLDAESVPQAGRTVLIQRNGNLARDVTDAVHPEVAGAAALAARIVGLDIAGVDLVAEDIARPLAEQGGAVIKVNAGPGLLMHLKPAQGAPRPVGRAIVDHLFPDGDDGRIPVVGISGSRGKTAVAKLLARLLHLSGRSIGMACSDGLYLDQRQVEAGDRARWEAARQVLMNRSVEVAVLENGFDAILGEGLAYDRCQVGVLTNIDPALHYGHFHIEDADKLHMAFRTQVDVVLKTGVAVLNAADPMVMDMAPLCDGEVILFAADGGLPALAAHRANGGRAVTVDHGTVVLAGPDGTLALAPVEVLNLADLSGAHLDNKLAALGAAWALGVAPELMRAALVTLNHGA